MILSYKLYNPFDQEVVAKVSWDSGRKVEEKLHRARAAFEIWRHAPMFERIHQVKAGLARFRKEREAIARDITRQMGKPLAQSRREVETFFERADYMVSIAAKTLAPEVLPVENGLHRQILHEPLGIVFNIAAWNYPLLIPVNVVVPALLAGNVVLLKHSAKTPLTGLAFERAFGHLDPPHLVTSLTIRHGKTADLVEDPRIDYVAFTGSVEGGKDIYLSAANRFVNVGLELGGKDPAYVAEDADLDFAVENIVDGATYNAGQSCCAVERVYVHHRLYAAFLTRAKAAMERLRLGDPMSRATTLGPLASREALEKLEEKVEEAVKFGARLMLGGRRIEDSKGNFFPPTLLADVPQEAKLMREETFGPVLPAASVSGDKEALARMADTRFGLTASIWTKKRSRAEAFAHKLNAGTIFQNRCDYLDPALPWTGMKDSGFGSTLSHWGFYHLTKRKSLHFRDSK